MSQCVCVHVCMCGVCIVNGCARECMCECVCVHMWSVFVVHACICGVCVC